MILITLFPVKLIFKLLMYALSLIFTVLALTFGLVSGLLKKPCTIIGGIGILVTTLMLFLNGFAFKTIVSSYAMSVGTILIPLLPELITEGFIRITSHIRVFADDICLF